MSELARTAVKLLEAAPYQYNDRSLRGFASLAPTNDELLIATEQALVYQTNFGVLRFLKRAWTGGASLWAPTGVKQAIRFLASYVDTDDRTMIFPWSDFQIEPGVHEAEIGRYLVPFYFYSVYVPGGSVNFLQMPVNHRIAEEGFRRMAAVINS